jgi:sec-independent protein translocase protein TatA
MLGFENPIHILFLLLVLLLVFGAKRLPEIGRSLGIGMRGFKDALTSEPGSELGLTQGPNSGGATSASTPKADGPAQ